MSNNTKQVCHRDNDDLTVYENGFRLLGLPVNPRNNDVNACCNNGFVIYSAYNYSSISQSNRSNIKKEKRNA